MVTSKRSKHSTISFQSRCLLLLIISPLLFYSEKSLELGVVFIIGWWPQTTPSPKYCVEFNNCDSETPNYRKACLCYQLGSNHHQSYSVWCSGTAEFWLLMLKPILSCKYKTKLQPRSQFSDQADSLRSCFGNLVCCYYSVCLCVGGVVVEISLVCTV